MSDHAHGLARTHHAGRTRPLMRRNVLSRSTRFGPNMTPMVDVTLVILIFFMAATTIAGQEWFLRTDLPKDEDQSRDSGYALPAPVLDAELFVRDGAVLVRGLGDRPRALGEFIAQISAIDEQSARGLVLGVRAGDEVPYGSVAALHDAASSRGIRVALR